MRRAPELTVKEIAAARLFVDGKMTQAEIAEKVGMNMRTLTRKRHSEKFLAYEKLLREGSQEAFAEGKNQAVRDEARLRILEQMKGVEKMDMPLITAPLIITKLFEFAMIEPRLTGYNTSGQRQAFDSIWEKLGLSGNPPSLEELRENKGPDVYQAAWMRKTQ